MNKILDLIGIGGKILDKVIQDPDKRQEAKLKLLELQQNGEFRADEMKYSAILEEAKSDDPWTSRARPTFLYIIYIFILSAIPFGVLFYFNPGAAQSVTEGVKLWLQAIPGELYALFGAGYLGYGAMRSGDKKQKLQSLKNLVN